jgi:hypothetical protein
MWRSQLAAAAEAAGAAALADGEEAVARLGSDAVVAVRAGELLLYVVGGGAFGELAVAEAARAAAVAVRAACKKPPTEAIALEKYAKLCFYLDEAISEAGLADALDAHNMRRGTKMATAKEVV